MLVEVQAIIGNGSCWFSRQRLAEALGGMFQLMAESLKQHGGSLAVSVAAVALTAGPASRSMA